jgi:hypothetical protein
MAYFTTTQYNKICKYCRVLNKLDSSIDSDYVDFEKKGRAVYDIWTFLEKLRIKCGKLRYFEQEYEKYLKKIGFELNNSDYDEALFNLLNYGVEMDELVIIDIVLK